MDAIERFWVKVDKRGPDECWPWTAGLISSGYGMFHPSKPEQVLAHRFSYTITTGEIPVGLVIDHLCHNKTTCKGGRDCQHRKCCNPVHLTVRTNEENLLASPNHNSKKVHCPRGHLYDEANTYYAPSKPGSRRCLTCARQRDASRPSRKRRRT